MRNAKLRRLRSAIFEVEKTISITYSQIVFVALGIQHEKHVHHTVICGLSGSTLFSHFT